jgi:hypothetical protein
VKTLPWLPQNDLLGNPKTRLFVTHCGNGGQYESVYHGVPMVGLPIFADQPHNCQRMTNHGFGIEMDIHTFHPDELLANMNKVMKDMSYKEIVHKTSMILKDMPSGRETAAFWIDHVIKHGGAHLRSHAVDMPFYKYFMLDILVVLCIAVSVIIAIAVMICKLCFIVCRNSKPKAKTE